jgi:hypothetical protein
MYDRFDLEQQIMAVWQTSEDIQTVLQGHMDNPAPMTEDQMANALLGLKTLHDLRCERLFSIMEHLIKSGDLK